MIDNFCVSIVVSSYHSRQAQSNPVSRGFLLPLGIPHSHIFFLLSWISIEYLDFRVLKFCLALCLSVINVLLILSRYRSSQISSKENKKSLDASCWVISESLSRTSISLHIWKNRSSWMKAKESRRCVTKYCNSPVSVCLNASMPCELYILLRRMPV